MKKSRLLFCAIAIMLVFCGIVYAQPKPGDYDSRKDDFRAGHWAEILYGGGEGQPGNIIRAGAENYYEFRGARLDNVVLIATPKDEKGDVIRNYYEYRTVYKGGELALFNYDKAGWYNGGDIGKAYLPYLVKLQNTIVITKKYVDLNGDPTGEMEFALIVVDARFLDFPGYTVSVTAKFEKGKPIAIDDPTDPYPAPVSDLPKPPGYWGRLSWAVISIKAPEMIYVPVDIKPGSCPNPVNIKSNGVLPVAILGTADFSVISIDPDTILLNGVKPLRWNYEDASAPFKPFVGKPGAYSCNQAGPDGQMDIGLKFDTQSIVNSLGSVLNRDAIRVLLTGKLWDGTDIRGEDVIVTVPNGAKPTSSSISNKVLDVGRGITTKKIKP